VGKLSAVGLANLNFERLRFSGGVGSYRLDFEGALAENGDVEVDVGLGSVVLIIPRDMPVQVRYAKNWLSSFSLDDAFVKKRRDTYETASYPSAERKLSVRIESGLGSVSVRAR
jgi:predicted membrane protein